MDTEPEAGSSANPLSKLRAESVQRLQVGAVGLGAMLMMVGLVNVIIDRAKESEASAVPDAVATVASPQETEKPQDPLVDAGIVPEVAPSDSASPAADASQQADPVKAGQAAP